MAEIFQTRNVSSLMQNISIVTVSLTCLHSAQDLGYSRRLSSTKVKQREQKYLLVIEILPSTESEEEITRTK